MTVLKALVDLPNDTYEERKRLGLYNGGVNLHLNYPDEVDEALAAKIEVEAKKAQKAIQRLIDRHRKTPRTAKPGGLLS